MKFKQYISEIRIDNEIIKESIDTLVEAESTVTKLRTLYKTSDLIQDIDLANIFTDIRAFMGTKISDMKITKLQKWGLDIIKNLESSIKIMLNIRSSIKTKYLDSLIVQSNKLVNNIKKRINFNKEAYNIATL